MTGDGPVDNLLIQFQKIVRHSHQGSFETRARYVDSEREFCKFLAKKYGIQNLSNIKQKHVEQFGKYRLDQGIQLHTVLGDLSAIRFWHDQNPNARHILKDAHSGGNKAVREHYKEHIQGDHEKPNIRENKAWSPEQQSKLREVARGLGRTEIDCFIGVTRELGGRIAEMLKLDHAEVTKAIKTGEITLRGKGGYHRTFEITPEAVRELKYALKQLGTKPGEKLFVQKHEKTHLVKNRIEKWIERHRSKVQNLGSRAQISPHGLRHAFTQHSIDRYVRAGYTLIRARKQTSEDIGHHRVEITRVYDPR